VATIYAGTSGFSYPSWRGDFYPRGLAPGSMLAHYQARLNAVELNQSFYHLPQESVLATWRDTTASEFRFCLKAPRGLTYSAAGFDKGGLAEEVGRRLSILGQRLGPILIQWPPSRTRDDATLELILSRLDRAAAVEFRHPSWFDPAVYRILGGHGAALVVTDDVKWPAAPPVDTAAFAYYRLRRQYDDASLETWALELARRGGAHQEVHVYFKHEVDGPGMALRLLARLS